jgi:hypothetical protein
MISWFRTEHDEGDDIVKILHIVKKAPDASTKKIIELQAVGNEVKTIELYKGSVSYEKLVADVFSHDKVICW